MRKHLSLALVVALAVPQSLMAQSASVSAVNERNMYGAPPAVSNVKEIAELDAQISNKIVQLETLRDQFSSVRFRSVGTIVVSAATLTALILAAKYPSANRLKGLVSFLNHEWTPRIAAPAALGASAIAFTVGFKEAARLSREIEEVTQDLREQQARLNQLYQAANVSTVAH